jgi:uncharacterized protein
MTDARREPSLLTRLRAFLGDTDAQLHLAWRYRVLAEAAPRYHARARFWARRALRGGAPSAGFVLAALLFGESMSEADQREILAAYRYEAERDVPEGQSALGWCYAQGVGTPQDLQQALKWYTAAATNGDRDAELWVAHYCKTGQPPSDVQSPAGPV